MKIISNQYTYAHTYIVYTKEDSRAKEKWEKEMSI